MEAIWLIVGLGIGGGAVWLVSRQISRSHLAIIDGLNTQGAVREAELKATQDKLDASLAELSTTKGQTESLRAIVDERDRAHDERLKVYQEAESRLVDTFKALSGDALENSTKQLLTQAEALLKTFRDSTDGASQLHKKEIENLLDPVKTSLQKLEDQNHDMERRRQGAYQEMVEMVGTMREGHAALTMHTSKLVKALQDPGTVGNWGEVQLQRVVEKAGLEEHTSYVTQQTFAGDDGAQRPDMVVTLPGDRCLIIDSKAPMRAYIDALDEPDEATKRALLLEHAARLAGHAKELKRRDYSRLLASTPDFVVLFVGSEAAFHAAHLASPTLSEDIWDCNVILASPNTLLALLRAVNYGWQQEKLAASARQLQADAATLYERICKITNDYAALGKALQQASRKYNDMGASLETRVLPAARKFRDFGIQSNAEMAAVEPVEFSPRPLQSTEFSTALPGLDDQSD